MSLEQIYARKRILILGGNGFIGANLIRKLLFYEASITTFVRHGANLERLQEVSNEIEIVSINYVDADELEKQIKRTDPHFVFNFTQPSHKELTIDENVGELLGQTSTLLWRVMQSLIKHSSNLLAFVHSCSSLLYVWDEQNYLLSESTQLRPNNIRGLIKLNERNLCLFFNKSKGFPVRLARIFRAYGPMDHNSKLIVKTLDAFRNQKSVSVGEKGFKRDFVYVEDLVEGILLLGDPKLAGGLEMNFGSGQDYSAIEIIEKIESLTGQTVPKTYDYEKNDYDRGRFIADISLAKETIGWNPRFSIEKGLEKTIAWYEKINQCQLKLR